MWHIGGVNRTSASRAPSGSGSPFRDRDYRHLFGAQVVALAGNGLATVALGLLAFELAGARAAAVLGTALAIKMVTYVVIAPIAGAYAGRVDRRRLLVALDLIRAVVVVALPFADQIWHVYVLVALMQAASAAFTPTFQATLPDILPDEECYTRALSYSQFASTLETLLSPLLAAVLISVVDFHWLFAGTTVGFLASAALVVSGHIPPAATGAGYRIIDRLFIGVRIFAATPRLRGLMGLNLAVASAGAIIMVNTVNLVQQHLGRPEADVAWLLAANGAGVLVAAVAMPQLLRRHGERAVMVTGAALLVAGALAVTAFAAGGAGSVGGADGASVEAAGGAAISWQWPGLVAIWILIGLGSGAVLTPTGSVLRRSSAPEDRPALFAAQFSLSHACWLLTYPIAGWVATIAGYPITFSILTVLAAAGGIIAVVAWPTPDPTCVEHHHPATIADPAHVRGAVPDGYGFTHTHELVIDRLHHRWPKQPRRWRRRRPVTAGRRTSRHRGRDRTR